MIFEPSKIDGDVKLPSSKSQSHRALICGALAGDSTISGVDLSNDIDATVSAIRALGAGVLYDEGERRFTVTTPCKIGMNGRINCKESASTLRFFIPLAAALKGDMTFIGGGRLPSRPTDPYKPLLEAHGARLEYPAGGEFLPLKVSGGISSGEYSVRGDISSQFVTGLLFALTCIPGESRIILTTPLESRPYVDMTTGILRRFGAKITEDKDGYTICGGGLSPLDVTVEGDCSQAAFFAVAAAIGGRVRLRGVPTKTAQGDFALFDIVKRFGARVRWLTDSVEIEKAELHACDIDAKDIPDLVPALSVLAALSKGVTRIYGGGRLRIKESDRISATAAMLRDIGGEVTETDDGLIIVGKDKLCGGRVSAQNDHRIAMSAAAASAGCLRAVEVDDMSCIAKSYPNFTQDFRKIMID